jgi:glycosyltransferase involved in cell wall biosynthesis
VGSRPLVSVVIPVYNGMPFIHSAIDSVLCQSYPNIEIIVINNASTDGTKEFLESVTDPRVRSVHRNELQSASSNWTQAIAESTGEFVKLVCADDLISPDSIEIQVATAMLHESCVMVCSRRDIVDPNGKTLKRNHGLEGLSGLISGQKALRKCMIAGTNLFGEPAAVLFRGQSIRGCMPWVGDLPYLTDLATYEKVLHSGDLFALQLSQASFRLSSNSWSANILSEQPKQFTEWRRFMESQGGIRLNALEKANAIIQLKVRTIARKLYFKRIQHES